MKSSFTHYWQGSTVENTKLPQLLYAASNQFRRRKLEPGDALYIVTVQHGRLHLVGRMEVDRVTDLDDARRLLGFEPWSASDYALAKSGTGTALEPRPVPTTIARDLRFIGSGGRLVPLKYRDDDHLDQQTMRGVRRLSAESAAQLDSLLR